MHSKVAPLLVLFLIFSFGSHAQSGTSLGLGTVVIDPGHGGKDAGCVSADRKTYEKNLVLSISKGLASRIRETYPEMKVILTREDDRFVTLMDRASIATRAGAQLFISVHVNASPSGRSANGYSAYILGPSTKYDSYNINLEVCKRENSVIYLEEDSAKYADLDDSSPESRIMLQLMQNAFREQSLAFAESTSEAMKEGPFKKNWGVMQGNFCVLRQASMPAVLLEIGFISNPEDLSMLRSQAKLSDIEDKLFKAFRSYKEAYDSSVLIPEARKDTVVSAPQIKEGVMYGTQILSSGRLLFKNDSFFRDYELKTIRNGENYKYIIGLDKDPEKAKEFAKKVKADYPNSFVVRIEKNTVSPF